METEQSWDFFLYRRGEAHPTSVFADLAADSEAARKARPQLLTVAVAMKQPRPDGLSSNEEADTLFKLEDALMVRLNSRPNAQFVGRVTERGHRVWYVYLQSIGGLEGFIDETVKAAGYQGTIDIGPDAAWSTYHMVLKPNEVEHREMLDRQVLQALQKNGDDLRQPRGIQHWVYFAKLDDRDRFLAAARSRGFACMPTPPYNKPGEPRPFGASCHRVDSVAPAALHQVVADLVALAKEFGGEYDGWECQIVKPGQTPMEDRPKDAH